MSIVRVFSWFFSRISLPNNPDLVLVLLLFKLLIVSVVVGAEVLGEGVALGSEVWWRGAVSLLLIALWDADSEPDLIRHGRLCSEMWMRARRPPPTSSSACPSFFVAGSAAAMGMVVAGLQASYGPV
jgi:hypothetical protein